MEKTKSSYSSSHLQRNNRLQKTQNAEREREREREREKKKKKKKEEEEMEMQAQDLTASHRG